ncbi:hypothetical protein [Allosphingosinicella indica]|uniref:Lipoprotein n=1 Tax=Allosphingosinicella indica TaxID=941907 RepID=A0A1X7FZL0_9SPHN|nr:hypothetical protein [Allosphingosinicella indica]SMF61519.1 hypothetical protein SAMN06295910_0509 [Allosphingosinicella indica]
MSAMKMKTIDPRWSFAAFAMLAACGKAEEQPAAPATPSPVATASPLADATPVPLPVPEPVFTSLDRTNCKQIEVNREEGGYVRFECPGRGDWKLEVIEADAREDLALVGPGGAKRQMQLPSTIAGGAFSTLGKTVEWIGTDRLIVRYEVYESPEGRTPTSYLLAIDSAAEPPCVIGKVPPGPQQNEQARAIAGQEPRPACIAKPTR